MIDFTIEDLKMNVLLSSEMKPLMEECAEIMFLSVNTNFDAGGRPQAWKPLSPAYAKAKQKKYPSSGILQASGAMRNAIIKTVTNTTAMVSVPDSVIPYAKYHDTGTSKMPQRLFMMFQPMDITILTDKIASKVISFGSKTTFSQSSELKP